MEETVLVYTTDTKYPDTLNGEFIDVPSIPFLASKFPLYIGVRDGQVNRMKKKIETEKLGGISIGYWELNKSPVGAYLSRSGTLDWNLFKKHDVIFLASSDRIHTDNKQLYESLVDTIKQQFIK